MSPNRQVNFEIRLGVNVDSPDDVYNVIWVGVNKRRKIYTKNNRNLWQSNQKKGRSDTKSTSAVTMNDYRPTSTETKWPEYHDLTPRNWKGYHKKCCSSKISKGLEWNTNQAWFSYLQQETASLQTIFPERSEKQKDHVQENSMVSKVFLQRRHMLGTCGSEGCFADINIYDIDDIRLLQQQFRR